MDKMTPEELKTMEAAIERDRAHGECLLRIAACKRAAPAARTPEERHGHVAELIMALLTRLIRMTRERNEGAAPEHLFLRRCDELNAGAGTEESAAPGPRNRPEEG